MRSRPLETSIINAVTVEKILNTLSEEEKELLYLWLVDERPFVEIGEILGKKSRNKTLTDSAMRYRRDRLLDKLRAEFGDKPI